MFSEPFVLIFYYFHLNCNYLQANMLFEKAEYARAIQLYNDAIKCYGTSAVLYGNRAAAYMKRDWYVYSMFRF